MSLTVEILGCSKTIMNSFVRTYMCTILVLGELGHLLRQQREKMLFLNGMVHGQIYKFVASD